MVANLVEPAAAPRLSALAAGRIRPLDGVRGLAILLVLAGHVASNAAGIPAGTRGWLMAFANSSAGVRLFFVLSGYLITSLLATEYTSTGTISVRRFYWRRALRILPAFYGFLFTLALANQWGHFGISAASFTAAGTFTWNYALAWLAPSPEGRWYLGHLWTLALEQQFYLLWPLVLVMLAPARSFWVAVALVAWCPMARAGSYYLFPDQRGYLTMMLHTALDSVMVGCATALLVMTPAVRGWLARRSHLIGSIGIGWLLLASPCIAHLIRGSPMVAGFTIDAIASAMLISSLHYGSTPWLQAVFRAGPLVGLGGISYSLYLWQQFFLTPNGLRTPVAIVERLALAVLVATISFYLVEKPALHLRRRPASTNLRPEAR